jgi:hypothetical protein
MLKVWVLLLALSNGYNHNYNKGLASNKKLTNLVQIRSMRSLNLLKVHYYYHHLFEGDIASNEPSDLAL